LQFFYLTWVGEFLWYRLAAPYVDTCVDNLWSELCMATLNTMFYGETFERFKRFDVPAVWWVLFVCWPHVCLQASTGRLHRSPALLVCC
jgi:hypothetical protein